jgi:hypothetical protein
VADGLQAVSILFSLEGIVEEEDAGLQPSGIVVGLRRPGLRWLCRGGEAGKKEGEG